MERTRFNIKDIFSALGKILTGDSGENDIEEEKLPPELKQTSAIENAYISLYNTKKAVERATPKKAKNTTKASVQKQSKPVARLRKSDIDLGDR